MQTLVRSSKSSGYGSMSLASKNLVSLSRISFLQVRCAGAFAISAEQRGRGFGDGFTSEKIYTHPMSTNSDAQFVRDLPALEALFDVVGEASIKKEVAYLHPAYQAMIAASPFVLLATAGPEGLDISPRGDPPGFVHIQDEHTLLLPERRGNNRIDSLRNILVDPRVALFFMIPGVGETLRVNGRARISIAADVLQRFPMQGNLPKCVLEISVETVFFQCARAIQRSKIWEGIPEELRGTVPTPGAVLAALSGGAIDGAKYDRELPARQKSTLY